jgi:hypothetical protein
MKARLVLALVLIAAGTAALVYRGFSYPGRTRRATLGPVEVAVKREERVAIPVWAGVGAIAVGAVLLLLRRR